MVKASRLPFHSAPREVTSKSSAHVPALAANVIPNSRETLSKAQRHDGGLMPSEYAWDWLGQVGCPSTGRPVGQTCVPTTPERENPRKDLNSRGSCNSDVTSFLPKMASIAG